MYKKSKEKELTPELFHSPTSEYRGAPFWAWNQALDQETLLKHIDYFKEMGMGGFHMHSRTGLDTPYLGEEFMSCVRACVDKAKKEGMYAYLYDEDRWPSGAAGGKVTKDKRFRSRYLVLTPFMNEERPKEEAGDDSFRRGKALGNGTLLERYDIVLEKGYLKEYRRLRENEEGENLWYLYEELTKEGPWYNNQTYVDTLNPEAIQRFLEETHEKYFNAVGDEFGGTIPSIFTDEPQFVTFSTLPFAQSRQDVIFPYTDNLPKVYLSVYGEDLFDTIPELVWELPDGKVSAARYRYHDLVAEQFAFAFADTLGTWCKKHNIALTGHMFGEETLHSQATALGETMRSFRSFQLPGIDMLCDWREYGTAKQAQSATHQYGRPGVMSELYGVTGWDFDFRGHKLAGDWQAALGVTLRVHHLAWDSMHGEAKRDYPASIFYQSPWYREYKLVEDHFARLNTALTRGKAIVHIGVIHPIESYWLHYGPSEQTALIRQELEEHYANVTEWLLFAQLDFDYISEALLPDLHKPSSDSKFHVGNMAYDVIVLPGCETLRSSTFNCLKEFSSQGGTLLFMGDAPLYIDALPSQAIEKLYVQSYHIGFSKNSLLSALAPYREVELRDASGNLTQHLIYQLRQDGDNRWLFVANGKKCVNPDLPKQEHITFRIRGSWTVDIYDTLTGNISACPASLCDDTTQLIYDMYDHTSVLLLLRPLLTGENQQAEPASCLSFPNVELCKCSSSQEGIHLPCACPYSLSESNVLLLDQAEYRFYVLGQEPGIWQKKEEILRLDDYCRSIAGYPSRSAYAQPWVRREAAKQAAFTQREASMEKFRAAKYILELKFIIHSETDISDAMLALEEESQSQIFLNGIKIKNDIRNNYFVDECIHTLSLPFIPAGDFELIVKLPYTEDTSAEWYYLLGSFGVKLSGSQAFLTKLPEQLAFGDYCIQGFPFYAGNMTYETKFTVDESGVYLLAAEKFRAPLLKVSLDGRDLGRIAFSPYQLSLGYLERGSHHIALTSYGNRANAFGPIHCCNEQLLYMDPNAWRTTGASYSYEYQLKRMGILSAPRILRI